MLIETLPVTDATEPTTFPPTFPVTEPTEPTTFPPTLPVTEPTEPTTFPPTLFVTEPTAVIVRPSVEEAKVALAIEPLAGLTGISAPAFVGYSGNPSEKALSADARTVIKVPFISDAVKLQYVKAEFSAICTGVALDAASAAPSTEIW
ncbi:MAG: hypothetical protein E6R03_15935 [Hyphomicrobiaceae bacterium]|nr:MAG: hypothetical protein E6R03_15935 [Hyphomicrobiaceae bacterium]